MASLSEPGDEDNIPGIVEEVVEGALEVIYRKELARLAPSYNACRFVSDLVRTATWGCYPHDAELNAPHVAEEEPVSSAKDSWARSAVPIRPSKRKNSLLADIEVIAAFRQQHAQDPNNERTPSEGSRHSRVSSASRSYRSQRRKSSRLSQCDFPVVFEIPQVWPFEDQSFHGRTAEIFSTTAPNTAQRNEERHRREMEAAAERALQESLARQIKEAKGAKYTIDEKGRFILVRENVPSVARGVHVRAKDGGSLDVGLPAETVAGKPPIIKKAGGRHGDGPKPFFVEKTSLQPPLTEAATLGMGVRVQRGDVVKEGPAQWEDPDHMSKHQYRARKMGGDASSISGSRHADDASGVGSSLGSYSQRGPRHGKDHRAGDDGEDEDENLPQLDPIDITLGGRRPEPPPAVVVQVRDLDLEVTRAPDWGMPRLGEPHPGHLPNKPTSRQRRNMGKLFHGGQWPRERQMPGVVPLTAQCKKLAVPPPGYVMGHGLSVPSGSVSLASSSMSSGGGTQHQPFPVPPSGVSCGSLSTPRSEASGFHLPLIFSPNSRASDISKSPGRRPYRDVRQGGTIKYHIHAKNPPQAVTRLLMV